MGRKLGLTLDDVVAAAALIADRDGIDSVSLATVADALGVKSPSLYNHVEGLAGLRRALAIHGSRVLASELTDAVGSPDPGAGDPTSAAADSGEAVRRLAAAYRTFAIDRPGLYASMLPAPSPDDDPELAAELFEAVKVVAEVFASAGVDDDVMIPTIRAFRSTVHGFVDLENRGGFGLPDDIDESFDTAVEIVISSLG